MHIRPMFAEDPDRDLLVMVDRYGNEMHLTRALVGEITLALDDSLYMLRDGDANDRAVAEALEPVQEWLEKAEKFGRTPSTDTDNMQMTIVEES